MTKNKNVNNFFNNIAIHFKQHYALLIWVAIFCVIGIVIGLALLFGEKSYLSLLTTKNQNMLGYISGSASVFKLFFSRLFRTLFAGVIIFIFSLNYYTSFFSFFYFAYQSAICTIICGTLISYQGFAAIINTIFLIVPSNIVLLAILAYAFSVFFTRAKRQTKYKQRFSTSFTYQNFWQLTGVATLAIVALNIITSLIIPLIIKGICLVYY